MSQFGEEEGQVCWREGCQGVISEREVEGCYCHINPPCSACTEPREYCPECDWKAEKWDGEVNGYYVREKNGAMWGEYKPVPLDPRKIDYRIKSHTHFSQICEGVYPPGTERDDVLKLVKGTFGGRFEYFDKGKFKYIAYTD